MYFMGQDGEEWKKMGKIGGREGDGKENLLVLPFKRQDKEEFGEISLKRIVHGFLTDMSGNTHKRSFVQGFEAVVDSQRRLAIPKLWRLDSDTEETEFFLTLASGPSLEFYEIEEYARRQAIIKEMLKDEDSEFLASGSGMYSTTVKLDRQGRFVIPQILQDAAEIQTKVYCIGLMNFGRIYADKIWLEKGPSKQKVIDFNRAFRSIQSVSETKVMVTETQ